MEHQDHLEGVAKSILVRAKVWRSCPSCGEFVDPGGGDVTDAYKLGNYLITNKDPLVESFGSRREMTDTIKDVFDEGAADSSSCSCQRIWRENM